ncbi:MULTISPECIES: DUF6550 family protein [Clostridium]|uniref:Uncharacterized protein n=1 Tax=Clostridium manihotivorum TaxID=2320868 RepID=A0A3R5UBM6_9CLOT|nr:MULTISPECIES: DUF6550 family protein [Clostridium]EKQ55164.1 MAG: hypothetical protein A370_02938 [Clostridium sp. Maddingley MBC34-26]QAA34920.1 hypothetical protein C1I91_26590 [Clostridium manihotivorum]
MKKLNFNVKKNLTVTFLVVLAIALGAGLISYVNKTPKTKEDKVLSDINKVDEVKVDEIKTENEEKAKVPVINAADSTEKSSQNNVVSSNTETAPKKPEPPKEKPKTTDDITNKNKVPTYPEKAVKPQKESSPKGGEKNNKGQVYVPGFGWVNDEGGGGQGTNVTSDGDINKQVGTMD